MGKSLFRAVRARSSVCAPSQAPESLAASQGERAGVHGRGTRRAVALGLGFAALVGVIAAPEQAQAEPMDPAIERLVLNGSGESAGSRCRTESGAIHPDAYDSADPAEHFACRADNAAFKRLMNQWGWVIAPSAMHSARTTGFGGFNLSLEMGIHDIDESKDYWKKGTQGPRDPSSDKASIRNSTPDSTLNLYSVKIRKGFGFGLELTGQVGFIPQTSIISGGADVRMSLLEGFRTGVGGILPDFAVGGGVRTITGTPQFQLTVASLDMQISKPLPIADSQVITPWVGYQYVWIFGDSGLIDTTPATDPIGFCNYAGPNIPGNPDLGNPAKNPGGDAGHIYDGQPVCRGGSPLDFNNNVVFDKARLKRQRILFGLNYRYEMVTVGAQFITDLVDPADAQSDDASKEALQGEDRQWSVIIDLGAMF